MIREPLRIWSPDGPDEEALNAVAEGTASSLRLPAPSDDERRAQADIELAACLHRLRRVTEEFWERDWRREHKGFGIYPEQHLWNATWGYLQMLDAAEAGPSRPG